MYEQLAVLIGSEHVSTHSADLAYAATDWTPLSVKRGLAGEKLLTPAIVAFPPDEQGVSSVLRWAGQAGVTVQIVGAASSTV
ncbi:MAG: hypothetical protein LBK28_04250, partial [Propionibacteriaceae bacterium]|nr:hypothetical protein [Propionibacteriaceae bacterium]